jgi:ectoine hydroxylase-related dioxygenase (phytanoyl-CoA dioxygenase family)
MPVFTTWVALGDVTFKHGTLCMSPGTHRLRSFAASLKDKGYLPVDYGAPMVVATSATKTDTAATTTHMAMKMTATTATVTKTATTTATTMATAATTTKTASTKRGVAVSKRNLWVTAEMRPGDVILFNIKTIHAATVNTVRQGQRINVT